MWQAHYLFCVTFRRYFVAGHALWRRPMSGRSTFNVSCCVVLANRIFSAALSGNTHQSTLYILHFTLYKPHVTFYTLQSQFHTSRSTLYTPHFTLHTLHFTLYTLPSTLCALHFTLSTAHFTLYTVHCTLYTLHSLFHLALHTPNCKSTSPKTPCIICKPQCCGSRKRQLFVALSR